MADDYREVGADSEELLRALEELKQLESEKRNEDTSTPRFHELADRVEQQARTVMEIAGQQQRHGNEARPADAAIDDVAVGDVAIDDQLAAEDSPDR